MALDVKLEVSFIAINAPGGGVTIRLFVRLFAEI